MSASDVRVIMQHSITQLCIAPLCGAQQHHLLGCLLALAPIFSSINSSCCSFCFSSRQLAGQSAAFACNMEKSSATATMKNAVAASNSSRACSSKQNSWLGCLTVQCLHSALQWLEYYLYSMQMPAKCSCACRAKHLMELLY